MPLTLTPCDYRAATPPRSGLRDDDLLRAFERMIRRTFRNVRG